MSSPVSVCLSVRPSVCLSVCPSVCYPKLVRAVSQKRIDGSSPNLHTRCILASLLFLRGQGQRSRSPEVKSSKTLIGHISKTTGPIHAKDQNVQLVKGFPPICLVSEFHFRSKSSPEVKGQIHIFGHNSKTTGRIDLKRRPLDSSRRATQKCCSYFSSYDAPFLRYSRFCVFLDLVIFRPASGCGSQLITWLSAH